jgi:hypothetical protein
MFFVSPLIENSYNACSPLFRKQLPLESCESIQVLLSGSGVRSFTNLMSILAANSNKYNFSRMFST